MDIIRIIGIGLITVVASMIVKPLKPEISIIIGLCGGILILSQTINYILDIINSFTSLVEKSGLDFELLKIVLKIIGVGYLTEFSANVCNDAGSSSIADKILFAGKIIILFIALPIVTRILEIIMELLPWKKFL